MPRPPAERSISTLPITWSFSDESTGATYLVLGHRIVFSQPGAIIGINFLQSAEDDQPHGAALFGPDFSLLACAEMMPDPIAGGEGGFSWKLRKLPRVWQVQAATQYVFSVTFQRPRYAFSHGFFSAGDVTVGSITYRQNDFDGTSGNGVFIYNVFNEEPSGSLHDGTVYGIEPLFQAS